MTRFVVLHHTGWAGHPDHYDLMLQTRESPDDNDLTLLNYATVTNEFPAPGLLFALGNPHRQIYLHCEGPVSNNRGNVKRVDEGACRIIDNNRQDLMILELTGLRLNGVFSLSLTLDLVFILERFPLPD